MDSSSNSIVTERWSGHANLVINCDNIENLRRRFKQDETSPSWEPEMKSIWEPVSGKSYKPTYGFQKGYLLFTTIPPQCGINRLSENWALGSQTFPRAGAKHHNRSGEVFYQGDVNAVGGNVTPCEESRELKKGRCKSTCNITLSYNDSEKWRRSVTGMDSEEIGKSHVGANFSNLNHDQVDESRSPGGRNDSRGLVFTTHFCTNILDKSKIFSPKRNVSHNQNEKQSRVSSVKNTGMEQSRVIEFPKGSINNSSEDAESCERVIIKKSWKDGSFVRTTKFPESNVNTEEFKVLRSSATPSKSVNLQRPSCFVCPTLLRCVKVTDDGFPNNDPGSRYWDDENNDFYNKTVHERPKSSCGFTNDTPKTGRMKRESFSGCFDDWMGPKIQRDKILNGPLLANGDLEPLCHPGKAEFSSRAQKFGTIAKLFKKSDKHVGPAKNSICTCNNCRWHFEGSKTNDA